MVDHPEPTDFEALADAAVLRMEVAGRRVGYAWYVWITRDCMALCVHLESARGHWTRAALGDLHKLPEMLGARRLVAKPRRRSSAIF